MNRVNHIEIDLGAYKLVLQYQNAKPPLILHFDTPSRKFYLSLIALIVREMKRQDRPGYVNIRKHEDRLKYLDDALAGSHASQTVDGMWEKIRKAWHYSIPNLEEAANFKIENRDHVSPYEKGGKYLYECTEDECDMWASLFSIDEITNKWRFKFAVDEVWLGLSDVVLTFGDWQDDNAWDAFLRQLEKPSTKNPTDTDNESAGSAGKAYPIRWQLSALAVVVLFALLIGGAAMLNRYLRPVPPPTESVQSLVPSIAVLPFINVSDNPDKDYFCDGITEELINSLAKVKDLRVISRTSAFALKKSGLDIRTIGEKLGVENVLEGSVRVVDNKLRITAQLINTSDDSHLWAGTYDGEMKEVFGLQENIATEIACSLKSRLGCKSDEIIKPSPTKNFDVYNLYLKGRYFYFRDSFQEALGFFQQAIELAPEYAPAYSGIADTYRLLAFYYHNSNTIYYQKAKTALLKALELDDQLPEAYVSLAIIKILLEWDWQGAEKAILQAMALDPGSSAPHTAYELLLRILGRVSESVLEGKIALTLDPLSNLTNNRYGIALMVDRQYDAAVSHLEETLEMFPQDLATLQYLGDAYLLQNRYVEGIEIWEKVFRLFKDRFQFVYGTVGHAYAKVGNLERARIILNEALEKRKASNFSPFAIALIYKGLGNTEKTFEWLDIAYDEHEPAIVFLLGYPQLWDLHADPRFQALRKKIGIGGN